MRQSYEPRIKGGYSLHEAYDPQKCPKQSSDPEVRRGKCGGARCVDCCGTAKDTDIDECSKCGLQVSVSCYFDEECS